MNWVKGIKSEMDVEFFACVHAASMIFVYGFEQCLTGIYAVSFLTIFQMFLLSYGIAWMQKLLFWKEKQYSNREFIVRACFWILLPVLLGLIVGYPLGWYQELPLWLPIVFSLLMLTYYIMVWFALQIFYKDETQRLNTMLSNFKHREGKNHVSNRNN